MGKYRIGGSLVCIMLILGMASPAFAQDTAAAAPATPVDRLNAVLKAELDAEAFFTAAASKADEEGFAGAATLFRAAAEAKKVQVGVSSEAIKKKGGTPVAEAGKPELGATADNLAAAIKNESHELETLDTPFLKLARSERDKEAILVFNRAEFNNKRLVRMLRETGDSPEGWKKPSPGYYVCETCGYTTLELPSEKCSLCFEPKEQFKLVK